MPNPSAVVRSVILFLAAGVCEIGGGWLVWRWPPLRDYLAAACCEPQDGSDAPSLRPSAAAPVS